MIKKVSILIACLVLFGISTTFAQDAASAPGPGESAAGNDAAALMTEYLSKRFVCMNDRGHEYCWDMKDVTAYVYDRHDWFRDANDLAGKGVDRIKYFLLKSGFKLAISHQFNGKAIWNAYRNFLKENPKFLYYP